MAAPESNLASATRKPTLVERSDRLVLSAKSLKVTLVIDAAQLAGVELANGSAPQPFVVAVAGRKLVGQLNPKTLRKVLAMVREHGSEAVAVILQGQLADDAITEAGITAQLRTPRAG
jgi:hypothetical protein